MTILQALLYLAVALALGFLVAVLVMAVGETYDGIAEIVRRRRGQGGPYDYPRHASDATHHGGGHDAR